MREAKVNVGTIGHVDYGKDSVEIPVNRASRKSDRVSVPSRTPKIKPFEYKRKLKAKRKRAAQARKRNFKNR